jgi:hypothetical protein
MHTDSFVHSQRAKFGYKPLNPGIATLNDICVLFVIKC